MMYIYNRTVRTMRICIVSYYGLKEALESAATALRNYGNYVTDFPLYRYMYDQHDKTPDYCQLMIDFLLKNKIDIVLWWFINIDVEEFKMIKEQSGVKYSFFNWDEPYNWTDCQLAAKSQYFDSVFVTCLESLDTYRANGCKNPRYLLPGYDPFIHYPETDYDAETIEKYSCDISFCCTNLYTNSELYPNQFINRKQLIDTIYDGQESYGYTFHIYGPESFAELYPNSYRGFISYDKSRIVFNLSKINLCTHVLSNMDGYLNERVILVAGSGGLLLVDPIKGIEKIFNVEDELILLQSENQPEQIRNILDNYRSYENHRKKIEIKARKLYSYQSWAKCIHQHV
jgi:hypothetical protein